MLKSSCLIRMDLRGKIGLIKVGDVPSYKLFSGEAGLTTTVEVAKIGEVPSC